MKFFDIRKMVVSMLFIAAALTSSQALAHKLSVFAYAEGNDVFVEGYFADGKRAQNSKVEVFNPAGKLVYQGVTGDKGDYTFTVTKAEDLKIVINAGMGHRGVYLLPANELGDGTGETDAEVPPQSAATTTPSDGGDTASTETSPEVVTPPASGLEATVRKAVNEAIRPLLRELDETREKTSLRDKLGAIGYIFGVMGVFFYFKARQQSNRVKE
jgi:nickel transport protein